MTSPTSLEAGDAASTGSIIDLELFRAFFGPNSGKFEKMLHRMGGPSTAVAGLALSWCWPAFFLAVPWFFYRKMYVWGVGIVVLLTALEMMLGESNAGRFVFFAIMATNAKALYIHHASGKLTRLRATHADEAELLRRASEQGGVS